MQRTLYLKSVVAIFALLTVSVTIAQEKSVRPGINKSFENPTVEDFVGRFEREGRDAFDHQKEIVQACKLKHGMVVADIGAGTGLFTRLFSPAVGPEGKVYAVDIAEKFVKHIELSAREQKMTNVTGIVCSQDSVNLPTSSIDIAFICDTYHHFEFPHKTMRSIHQALKPDGRVVLIDFQKIEGVNSEFVMSHVRARQEVFTKEIVDAGFRQVEEVKGMLDESYFVRFEKADRRADALPAEPVARLEAAGLVESAIGEGVRIRTIDREMLEEAYIFREAIEAQAIREACDHASDREVAKLRGLSAQMEAAEEQEAIDIDQEFHLKIAKMSRCQRLVKELKQLHLLQMFVSQVTVGARVGVWPFSHMHLVEPIEKRDPLAAEEQMRCHIRSARKYGIHVFLESRSE